MILGLALEPAGFGKCPADSARYIAHWDDTRQFILERQCALPIDLQSRTALPAIPHGSRRTLIATQANRCRCELRSRPAAQYVARSVDAHLCQASLQRQFEAL